MCLDREWCSGLYARSIAALLSRCKAVASGSPSPSSSNKARSSTVDEDVAGRRVSRRPVRIGEANEREFVSSSVTQANGA
eukprot:3049518-Pleurochrysis_carterae.AAC.1